MRIDLNTPFAEKDKAKSLGARWDPAKRVWFIQDVEDLTPFLRWIPEDRRESNAKSRNQYEVNHATKGKSLHSVQDHVRVYSECSCDVLPWEDCPHTKLGS